MGEKLKKANEELNEDIDLYLRLLTYGSSFTFKSKWFDRRDLYNPRPDEESIVKRCKETMLNKGLLKVRETRIFPNEDVLELTLLGDEVQKTGWKKYLIESSKKKFNWDKFISRANIIFSIILSIATVFSLALTISSKQDTEQLNKELDSIKSTINTQNSKLILFDTLRKKSITDSTSHLQK